MADDKRTHKKTYVDLLIIEAPLAITNKQGQIKALKKVFCLASSLSQEISTSSMPSDRACWNDDCTFTLDDEYEEIKIEIFHKKNAKTILLGQVFLHANSYPSGKSSDVWLPIQPPPSCDSKYVVTGKLHVVLQHGRNHKNMMLRKYGEPQKDVAIRLSPGDLILCHNNALITHTVHISTRSQWDHVAMVIAVKEHDDLLLFEATLDGVEAYLLNTALKYYRKNGKIAIRRANFVRTKEFMENLYEFVNEVNGRPYKQDWIQLVRASYNANEEDDLSSLFCSQLVAAAYQRLGLISKEVCSNNFVPSDFANDFQGELKGCSMSNVRKVPSISSREIELKDQFKDEDSVGSVKFNIDDDQIHNVKFTDTAMKRDAKLNLYTVYIMNVTTHAGWRWILFKRYADFVALDKELQKYFTNIPSLPRKYLVKIDETTIQRRRVALQHYFKCLVRSAAVFCSILYEFLTTGRKGVSLDPNRVVKKPKTKPKKRLTKSKERTTKKSPLRSSKKDILSPKTRRKTTTDHATRKSKTQSATIPSLETAIIEEKLSRPPKSKKKRSQSRMSRSKESVLSGESTKTKVDKRKSTSSWTRVGAPTDSPVVTPLVATTRSSSDKIIRKSPQDRTKNLIDLTTMFGNRFYLPNDTTSSADTDLHRQKFQRTQATFYLKKFSEEEVESDSEENSDNFVIPEEIMKEENITKLSDIGNLDLVSLGIDDVDLADFDLNDEFLDDITETGLDVDELLNEFGTASC